MSPLMLVNWAAVASAFNAVMWLLVVFLLLFILAKANPGPGATAQGIHGRPVPVAVH